MGCLPHRSAATVLTAVAITAIAQPLAFINQPSSAQVTDPNPDIEFIPDPGSPADLETPDVPTQVVNVEQGTFTRGSQSSNDADPLATSTFTSNSATGPQDTSPNAASDTVPAADASSDPSALPAIPIPAQPVTPQSPPQFAADGPGEQPAIPTSYDYQRPVDNRPTSTAFVSKGQLPEGTVIPAATFRDTKFDLHQEVQVNLSVAEDITDAQGRTIVPSGSTVWGRFEPIEVEEKEMVGNFERTRKRTIGSHFIAERIDIQSSSYALSGQSSRIPSGFDPDADVDRVALKGAGIGVLGGVAFGVLTGGVGFLPLMAIGGMGGAMTGAATMDSVVALDADSVVEIHLSEPFLTN